MGKLLRIDNLYRALREALEVPENDQLMTVTEHEPSNFRHGAHYLGMARSDELVYLRITGFNTRTPEKKKTLSRRLAQSRGRDPGIHAKCTSENRTAFARRPFRASA